MQPLELFSYNRQFLPDLENVKTKVLKKFPDTEILQEIAAGISGPYVLLYTGFSELQLYPQAIERLIQVADMSRADLIYSDYCQIKDGTMHPHPTLEYQAGSLRDDFDFGTLVLYRTTAFQNAVAAMDTSYRHAALYDLRLKIARHGQLLHIPEFLYAVTETDNRTSGEKQFDYVDPRNREVQREMEKACTRYLKDTGAWLPPECLAVDFRASRFDTEATVVIPVKNRAHTIADAVTSALGQKSDFPFNIIVVDNHSEDGTTDILHRLAQENTNLIHHIPTRTDLGIGGCWNEAILHPQCGKFAMQLDSDDLYNSPDVLAAIVAAFYEQDCAMVIGSYQMVNFKLEEIPPGIIDHREWTDGNGRNNALRINGLGAPRAFYTPVIRELSFPNVSYGEDYAVALAISRHYRIGRIYTPLYLCRRWEGNSDAALDIRKLNEYNFYKDKIRTLEIMARRAMK